jgi:carbamoyl-phosphate synthase small subunit
MMGAIVLDEPPLRALERLQHVPRYGTTDLVREVSSPAPYLWEPPLQEQHRIVVVDSGVKFNIMRILRRLGCQVTVVPCTATAEDVLGLDPDGVILSPGPGDPAILDYLVATAQGLVGRTPLLGICLGHQVIARAFGARTFKLKFGHRGANHPVKDLLSGRVFITAQNHGYAVDGEGLRGGLEVWQVHLNDGTVEGLYHRELPILGIQYHSEASPGPWDNEYVFQRFLEMVSHHKEGRWRR